MTIIGRRPNLLPEADEAVAEAFTDRYAERFTVHAGHAATALSERGGTVTVEARPYEYGDDGGIIEDDEPVTVTGDALLLAAGRVPNTDVLNVEATGVETDDRGFVETDKFLRTTTKDVWALGDIVGEYLLKHSANHDARAAAVEDIRESVHVHPALPEVVQRAFSGRFSRGDADHHHLH